MFAQELTRYCVYPYGPKDGVVQDETGPCEIKGDWFGPYQARWIPSMRNEVVAVIAVALIYLTESWLIKGARADQGSVFNIGGRRVKVKRYEGSSGYTLKI